MKMFTVYSYTEPAMVRYKQLVRAGYNIGGNDLRIAAIAMEYDLVLVTRNLQHFHRIPDLHIEVW
jgi:tRNA(fMet)-specific endonuclease VapC